LRENKLVVITPGFAELAGGGNAEIQEVRSATPEASKTKKSHKYIFVRPEETQPLKKCLFFQT